MDLSAGYKQTEVGIIPDDWNETPLLKAVRIANGQVDPRLEPYRSMILVAPDHIERSTGRLMAKVTASEQGAISGKYLFEAGDVIYSKIRPYLRKAVIAEFRGLCSADMYPLKAVGDVVPGFIHAVLLAHRFSVYAESVSVRSGMPKINRTELADFSFALPPSAEQLAIAVALNDVDALIGALDKLIAKKRDLKQAAMQQLLTGQTRLQGFVGEWIVKTFGDVLLSLEAGVSVNSSSDEHDISIDGPFILKTSSVFNGRFDVQERKAIIPPDRLRARTNPLCDTILISRMNTPNLVGEIGYVEANYPDVFLPDRLWMTRFKADAKLSVRWLAYLLSSDSYKKQIKEAATGTSGSMKNISKGSLLNLRIEFPSFEEQAAIAKIFSDMDAELTALEARCDKTRALKQGMMQELLTGRIRLV